MSGQPPIELSQLDPSLQTLLEALTPTSGTNGQVLTNVSGTSYSWQNSTSGSLAGLSDVSLSSPSNGQVLTYNGTDWTNQTATNSGTVTSVAATGSTGLVITGSPITTTGTLTFTLGTELQGLSQLSTNGFVQRTDTGTYTSAALTSTQITTAVPNVSAFTNDAGYLTTNKTITLSGDATGSGTTAIAVTLASTGVTAGTYNNVTVNAKGLVTSGNNTPYLTGNQTITVSGDVTGSGATTITLNLNTTGVTAGTYAGAWNTTTVAIPTFTVNAKGLITAASMPTYTRTLFTSTTQGEVPSSGGGTTNYLRADGTWSAPSSGSGSGTVTSVAAVTSGNGLTITGSPITTTGTLTFTLGTELQGLSGLGTTGFVQRTGTGTYTVTTITSDQITTALTYTPVPNSTIINTTEPLVGGGPLTSSLTLSMPAFDGSAAGYVPTNGIVTETHYLRDDGTWQIPPGNITMASNDTNAAYAVVVATTSSSLAYPSTNNLTFNLSTGVLYASTIVTGGNSNFSPTTGDITVSRPTAATTGAIFFGDIANSDYLFYNGTNFVFDGGQVQASSFDATSDERLKTNIVTLQDTGTIIDNIDGVTFNWKKDGNPSAGVIAQQVQKVMPQAVSSYIENEASGGTDEYLTVNYNALVAVLIEQVKILRLETQNLRDRIRQLEIA